MRKTRIRKMKDRKDRMMYKMKILMVKYIPMITALVYLIAMILSYHNVDITIFDILVGNSLITTIPMYISSYVFKFCKYHRMFIHYLVAMNLIDFIDVTIGIPASDFNLLMIYMIIAGVFAFLALYYHQKYGGRRND
jgi:hypothetical protein